MAVTPDCPPFRPGGDALTASFLLTRAGAADAVVELRDRGVRKVQATCLLGAALLALVIVSATHTGLVVLAPMVVLATMGIGTRRFLAKGVRDRLDRMTSGSGELRYALVIGPDGLRQGGDAPHTTVPWQDLTCQRSRHHLALSSPDQGLLVLPFGLLPPGFAEALLQRVRAAGGVERPEVRPAPTVIRVGQVALTSAVTVLVAWAIVADVAAIH